MGTNEIQESCTQTYRDDSLRTNPRCCKGLECTHMKLVGKSSGLSFTENYGGRREMPIVGSLQMKAETLLPEESVASLPATEARKRASGRVHWNHFRSQW